MEYTSEKVKIISAGAITAMLRRMAFEIYERNFATDSIILAGIGTRGAYIADQLEAHLREISNLVLRRADFEKREAGLSWSASVEPNSIARSTLLIVDDVLYSGGTIVEALALTAAMRPDKIQTAVLVDRGHHRFPIQANFVGMEIATSLKQYVSVEIDLEAKRAEAFIY